MMDFEVPEVSNEKRIAGHHKTLQKHLSIVGFADRMENTKDRWLIDALVEVVVDQERRIKKLEETIWTLATHSP